jgi:hypothetical protein
MVVCFLLLSSGSDYSHFAPPAGGFAFATPLVGEGPVMGAVEVVEFIGDLFLSPVVHVTSAAQYDAVLSTGKRMVALLGYSPAKEDGDSPGFMCANCPTVEIMFPRVARVERFVALLLYRPV